VAIKKRLDKRHGTVGEDEAAWLRGDRNCGFVQFKPYDELQELWDRHGDHETMFWNQRMHLPALIADLETEETE
jgi:hypothetical protein